MNKRTILPLLLAVALLCLPLSPVSLAAQENQMSCRFIAMSTKDGSKSGDCALITSPDGQTMLIDAGAPAAVGSLIERLKALGIQRIDYLVASHPHIDHIGGMPLVMAAFEVGTLLTSAVTYDSSYTRALSEAAQQRNIPTRVLSRGDSFNLGAQVQVHILWPEKEITYYERYPEASTQFINDLSLVMRIEYDKSVFLFSGDLYAQGEKAVLATGASIACNMMKINHHGDNTSSSKAWRSAANPEIAVATNNSIVNLQVLKRYQKDGIRLYHTLVDGDVLVTTTGQGDLAVSTGKERTGSFP